MTTAGEVLLRLVVLRLLHCISVWGNGLQCYDCDGQSMTQVTEQCWTDFTLSDRVRITDASANCLVCYTEVIDVMINTTTRLDRQLKRRCLYEMADKDVFDALPNKSACGVFMPQKTFDKPTGSGATFEQAERCYCMNNKCNTWMVKDRRKGTVQQSSSTFSGLAPGGGGGGGAAGGVQADVAAGGSADETSTTANGAASGSNPGSKSLVSSAYSMRFRHAGMGELCSCWAFWVYIVSGWCARFILFLLIRLLRCAYIYSTTASSKILQ